MCGFALDRVEDFGDSQHEEILVSGQVIVDQRFGVPASAFSPYIAGDGCFRANTKLSWRSKPDPSGNQSLSQSSNLRRGTTQK
jgi:hypothetical protein